MARPANSLRPRSKPWSRPLADLVGAVIEPVLAKQGFAETAIILHWEEIVGARIARASQPLKLQWPPRGPNSSPDALPGAATLIVLVEGAFALELQHQGHLVVERVNAHLGWRCIGKLAMRQGPVLKRPARRKKSVDIDLAALARAENSTRDMENGGLRDALNRLGARVLLAAPK